MPLSIGDKAPTFAATDHRGDQFEAPKDFSGKKTALMFLRHLGCPLCLEKIADLKENQKAFEDKNLEVIVIVQGTQKRVRSYGEQNDIPFRLVGDREKRIYAIYDVARGGLKEFLGPNVLKASIRAMRKGHRHGRFEGDELQVPADFVIGEDGKIIYAHYGKDISDFGSVSDLLAAV